MAGYFVALGLKTVPRHMRGTGVKTTMRIIALETAWYMDPLNNDAPVEHPPGAVLFEGAATVASVGSVPFYGYGMRIFPFAGQRPGTFQLRVASVRAVSTFFAVGFASRAMGLCPFKSAATVRAGERNSNSRWTIYRSLWSICARR
ncbi:MAG TPA: hypothetical protein EYP98_17910 [Planctomycetes bacterium]|nr:hypothetical protein [Planctomycetota bacterium]